MPPEGPQLLAIGGITAGYRRMQVLWGVDLCVNENETVVLLGANGAGKTTLLKTIMSLVEPWNGRIDFAGEDITRLRTDQRVKRGIVFMSETSGFPGLSIEENILIGAQFIPRAQARGLMAQLFGVRAIVVDDVDFTPDLPAMLRAVTPQTRLIFLASPNNPTGTRVTNEALDAFLRALPPHVIAVLDEAYYEFLDNPPDTVSYVKQGARVVLMRTFSKIQGLAGLRIGYGLASAEIANLLQRARQPFNANAIAQAGAIAGLADVEHQQKTKAVTDEGRKVMEEAFAKMGLKFTPSSANFVLVHVGDGGEVFKRLMKKGIIVRSMVSYYLPEYIRVSIGTPEQNAKFLAELPGALDPELVGTRVPSRPTNESDGQGLPSLPT